MTESELREEIAMLSAYGFCGADSFVVARMIRRHEAALRRMTSDGFVRVRVAVTATGTGAWGASGYSGWNDGVAIDAASDYFGADDDHRVSFVEAYVPKPVPTETVEGEVV